jgi:hypothetical protein
MAVKKRKRTGNKWQGSNDDAIKLAALRWFALEIESNAIQIYATDRTQFDGLERLLRECVQKMEQSKKNLGGGDDCPPGYIWCRTECAPMCLNPD